MTILLTGGTGKTGTRVASRLRSANKPFLLASRRGPDAAPTGYPAIKFDWTDDSTWPGAFEHQYGAITAIYMIEPQVPEPWVPMIKFVDFAREKGVRRFVLCSGTTAVIGKDGMGRVWEHYVQTGVDYCVLRLTWFMENLIEPGLVYTIGQMNKIFTACQDGQIPFISADDIADVAVCALTDEKSHNCDHRILGPELLTYDQVAETLSDVLGRKIEHVKLDEESRWKSLVQAGVSESFARFLAKLEVMASQNHEKALNDTVLKTTGHPPKSFRTFAEENKAVWSL